MNIELALVFTIFCGILGLILRRNLLNIITSILQIFVGANALYIYTHHAPIKNLSMIYLIIFLVLAIIMFLYCIAILLIRRRSTLNVNELTELRG